MPISRLRLSIMLDQPDSMRAAFDGVERIFLFTAAGPGGHAHDRCATTAARNAGAYKLAALGADTASDDPGARWHRAGERAVGDSRLAHIFLRPNEFMTNTFRWSRNTRADGAAAVPYAYMPSAVIDVVDIAAVAVAVLADAPEDAAGPSGPGLDAWWEATRSQSRYSLMQE